MKQRAIVEPSADSTTSTGWLEGPADWTEESDAQESSKAAGEVVQAIRVLFGPDPGLRGGLVTRWGTRIIVWLRVEGHPLLNVRAGSMTGLYRGVVPVAAQELPADTFIVQRGPIPICQFKDLRWDASPQGSFEIAEIEATFGPPIKRFPSRKFDLNDVFWSELMVLRSGLIYDVYRRTFLQQERNGIKHVSEGEVIQLVTRVLQSCAASIGERFPESKISPVEFSS